jgi:hypothetical protein
MACLSGALVLACIEKRLVSHVGYGAYDIQKVAQPISARRLRMRDFDSLHVHQSCFDQYAPNRVP